MINIIPYWAIYSYLRRDDVRNDRYVRLAAYALYIALMFRGDIDMTDINNIDQIIDCLIRRELFLEDNENPVISDTMSILVYTIVRVVDAKDWRIVIISGCIYTRHKDTFIATMNMSGLMEYQSAIPVRDTIALISYITYEYNHSYVLDETDRKYVDIEWGSDMVPHYPDTGVMAHKLYLSYSQIFLHYSLCPMIKNITSFADIDIISI